MEFRLLGPLEVRVDGVSVGIRGRRQRAVLAALALEANQPVTVGHLVAAAWDDPPPSAETNVRSYVMALRRRLNAADGQDQRLLTRASGYLLRTDPGEVDVEVLEALAARGEQALADADTTGALEHFDRACRLWRGSPLENVPLAGTLRVQAQRLTERRLVVVEQRVKARLDLGRHAELVDELTDLVSTYPLQERLWEHFMLALYRSGRQADALAAYHRVHRLLADEVGTDPNPGLQRLQQQILHADPGLQVVSPRLDRAPGRTRTALAPIPHQLPPSVPGFVGRDRELARLRDLLPADHVPADHVPADDGPADDGPAGGPVVIASVDGGAGVGKTALAVHFAHQAGRRFPDGQLYVNLRGHDPRQPPLAPGQVLGQFLRALGADPASTHTGPDEQAAWYRTAVADKRLLIVLDNAAGPEQVRPLLPGSGTCLVVVTSRSRLDGLVARDGAHRITLDVLSQDAGTALLTQVVGAERVAAEPDATAALIRLCGGLPLALRIAAERIARSHSTLPDLVEELDAEQDRLDVLRVEDDEDTTVRGALSWSYRNLPVQAARLFRLFGLHPGSDIGAHAAAALLDVTVPHARRLLNHLTGVHLVEETAPDRYRMHDLIHLFTRERADAEETGPERDAAVQRMLTWYLHTADAADKVIMPNRWRIPLDTYNGAGALPTFSDLDQAMRWCETERTNLLAAAGQAAAGQNSIAWRLPLALCGFFKLRKYLADWVTTHETGLDAAQRAHDRRGQRWILTSLGFAYSDLRRFGKALHCLRRALDLCRESRDRWVEALALTGLGLAYQELHRFHDALDCLRRAHAAHSDLDDPWGQALAQTGIGLVHRERREFDTALDRLRRAQGLYRELDDAWGQAWTLHSLADTHRDLRQFDQAIKLYQRALDIQRRIGDRGGQAWALHSLATVQHHAGRQEASRRTWTQALAVLDQLHHPRATELRRCSPPARSTSRNSGHSDGSAGPCPDGFVDLGALGQRLPP